MIEDNIWIGKNVQIDKLSTIIAPCIIGENTEIRPGAYLRGNVVIGDTCIIEKYKYLYKVKLLY